MLTKEQVKMSMQAKWRLHQIRFYIILLAVLLAGSFFIAFFSLAANDLSAETLETVLFVFGVMALVYSLCFFPFILFDWHQYLLLFRAPESYTVSTVTLDRPSTSSWYRGTIFYTVHIDGHDIETPPLWSSGIFAAFRLEDYNNKTVKVAYSATLDKLIVLG